MLQTHHEFSLPFNFYSNFKVRKLSWLIKSKSTELTKSNKFTNLVMCSEYTESGLHGWNWIKHLL